MTALAKKLDGAGNVVDRASSAADRLLDATRHTADAAIGSVAEGVHAVRDRASPALDRMLAPIDSLAAGTQAAPLKSLLLAAVAGATLMAVIGFFRGSRPR
jgi:hypothetical protein